MKSSRIFTVVLALFVIILNGPEPAGALSPPRQVIMVIVNRVSYQDLRASELPNIEQLMRRGGTGLMTIKTAGPLKDPDAYLTLGTGAPAAASDTAGENFNTSEEPEPRVKAGDVYFRNTGFRAPPEAVVQLAPAALLESNARDRTVVPGALGESLHRAGKKTAVIGTSDNKIERAERWAPLLAMDARGLVDAGDVSNDLLLFDPLAPFGWRTDYAKLTQRLETLCDRADFIVVETGDLVRLSGCEKRMFPDQVAASRQQALKRVDSFIGGLLPYLNENTLIMLVAPLPSPNALKNGEKITPLVIAGGAISPGSLLTSPTTRTPGLVTGFDLTTTVLAHLEVEDATGTMIGAPISGVPGSLRFLDATFSAFAGSAFTRPFLLSFYLRYLQVILIALFLGTCSVLWKRNCPFPGGEFLRPFLVSLLLFPFVFLLIPSFGSFSPAPAFFFSLGSLCLFTIAIYRIKSRGRLFLILGLANLLPVLFDVARGSRLMRFAVLGFDPLAGGRFYGIGNEYMGVLIGSALLSGTILLDRWGSGKRGRPLLFLAGLFYAGLVYFFAAPDLGANAGGTLAAVVAFGSAILSSRSGGKTGGFKTFLLLLGIFSLLGIVILIGLNTWLPFRARSHVAEAAGFLFSGNFALIGQILFRKAAANWHLIFHSPWGTTLFLQLLFLISILFTFWKEVRLLGQERPPLRGGFAGLGMGALAAILFNDSGVAAACNILVFLLVPLFFILFDRVNINTCGAGEPPARKRKRTGSKGRDPDGISR
ncbi:MAG: hypothetical protein QHH75_12350 [Bacillota bacterium]|nr:hypothetical protein [Bacillota bacterium]